MPEACTFPDHQTGLSKDEAKPPRFVINVTIKKDGSEPWEVYRGSLHCNELTIEILEEARKKGKDLTELIGKLTDLGALSIAPGKEWNHLREKIVG